MNPNILFKKYLGWCPGAEAASKFVPDHDIAGETIAIFASALMLIISFSSLKGVLRFIVMAFAAFIGVPACWIKLRGEKAGPQEGTYPENKDLPPSEPFGEFNLDSPSAEASVYGPSRSTAEYNKDMMISREWLHPDILWYRKRFLIKDDKEKKS
jgi:hypothetical protein